MQEYIGIIWRNFKQPIVIAILILALVLLLLGEKRDAWFVSVIIVINTIFGVVQEIRARRALKKLEIMSAPRARRINNDGTVSDIIYSELVVGDRIDVRMGDEVPADGRIISDKGLEINESLLTGESASVSKQVNDHVYASSVVLAGSALVEITATGESTRVGGMTKTLKKYEPQKTPLQKSIAWIIAVMTYGAVFLAATIFIVYYALGEDPVVIIKTITTAAVTVVPEGLLLASTLLLAFGSLRLAQVKVLPQKLDAIEAMALLDVLSVDKTGTLTSDTIQFSELVLWENAPKYGEEFLGIAALETSSGNATGDAMIAGLPQPDKYRVLNHLSFSSERKYSGVRALYKHKTATVLVGAPEFLDKIAPLTAQQKEMVSSFTLQGKRVLLAVYVDDDEVDLRQLPKDTGVPFGLIVLSNELRRGVVETVEYLQKNGVEIKVISGDNPETVRYVAQAAGVQGTAKVITGAELLALRVKDFRKAARDYTVFARVLPEQKEKLIKSLKKDGRFTGMIGDGVNDALALKKADLGVAMFAGSAATRRVADIVLLNNSFNSLPVGMRLGNKIMLAIEMIATLFFHKIIYGIVLLFTTLSLGIVYPFAPRHVTFMNIFLVTLPTILWTLFPPLPTYKVSPKRFWWDTLLPVLPIAVISGIVVALSYLTLLTAHPSNQEGVATTTVLIATFFGIYLVFLMSRMFNVVNDRKAKLARVLYILLVIFVMAIGFGFGIARDFFDFTTPAADHAWPLLALIGFAVCVQWIIAHRVAEHKNLVNKAVRS